MNNKLALFLSLTLYTLLPAYADIEERFSGAANVGVILPTTAGSAEYSLSPTFNVELQYKLLSWLGVGAISQSAFRFAQAPTKNLLEGALVPQVFLHLPDTGLYGALGAGFSNAYNFDDLVLYWRFVWGAKVGYRYRLPDSLVSVGPEVLLLFHSSSTGTNRAGFSRSLDSRTDVCITFSAGLSL